MWTHSASVEPTSNSPGKQAGTLVVGPWTSFFQASPERLVRCQVEQEHPIRVLNVYYIYIYIYIVSKLVITTSIRIREDILHVSACVMLDLQL